MRGVTGFASIRAGHLNRQSGSYIREAELRQLFVGQKNLSDCVASGRIQILFCVPKHVVRNPDHRQFFVKLLPRSVLSHCHRTARPIGFLQHERAGTRRAELWEPVFAYAKGVMFHSDLILPKSQEAFTASPARTPDRRNRDGAASSHACRAKSLRPS